MDEHPKLHDVVALIEGMPGKRLRRGQVGTLVEELAPNVFEVEFSDDKGRTYASVPLASKQFIVLHYQSLDVG